MIVVMRSGATAPQVDTVIKAIKEMGLKPHLSDGEERTIIGAIGDERKLRKETLLKLTGVENVIPIVKPYKLCSREFKNEPTTFKIGSSGTTIGKNKIIVMAGTCAVENYEITHQAAVDAKAAGATVLRGGAYKPRTSPYAFQGLGEAGLKILAQVGQEVGLPVITECLSINHIDLVSDYADIVQVGARNMQNFALLEAIGRQPKPVLLKRGMWSTMEELLMSAEYLLANGNYNVILCERGIRTFEQATRNTCDIAAVPMLKTLTHLPIVVDPSHATGERHLVAPVSLAAIAAGADGLIIETHPDPDTALCDGRQSLPPDQFKTLMSQAAAVAGAVGREV